MQTQVLTNDRIRTLAPSAFAEAAHESRSERYGYIPTITVIDALRNEGFMPVYASQSKSRNLAKINHTKHMIRFRREAQVTARSVGDVSAEVVLVNSHDGSSAYQLYSGLFRLICLNGMVAKMGNLGEARVSHSGKVVEKVIEASYTVLDGSTKALDAAQSWAAIELKPAEQMLFARAAAQLRFDPATQPVDVAQIIEPRRYEDRSNDLWTTFNRAQESLIRGGQTYRTVTDTGRGRRVAVREVKSIDRTVQLNQALWTLGAEMAKLKAA